MTHIGKFMTAVIAAALLMPTDMDARKDNEGTGIVAHRGFWNCEEAGFARNSVAALKCAQEAGFWGSEFDVNMTSDGVLLVYHDSDVEGKKIEKNPHEAFKYFRLENGEPIPTIDDYLIQGKKHPETMLVYELKKHSCDEVEDKFVDITIEKLKEHDLLDPSKVMFISFSYHMCKRLAEKLPDFTVQYLNGDKKPAKVKADKINGIDYYFSLLNINKKWVRAAHSLGMTVNAWTVNKVSDMERMLDLKVDMLTTDFPLEARKLMKENGITELK